MFDPILARLDGIARAMLPEHERTDRLVLARARVGCAVIAALVVIALVRVPMLVARGPHAQAAAVAGCAILGLLVPIIPRVAGSFAFAAHALVLVTLVPLVTLIQRTGGSCSPALLSLSVTPMIAVFLTGGRGGVAWSLVVGGIVCAYAAADRFGLSPPILFPPDAWKLEKSIGAFLLTTAVLGLALSYERARRMAETEAVEAARNADELVAARETDHRESLRWLTHSFAHEANNTLAYVMADLSRLDDARGRRQNGAAGTAARLGAERLRQIVRDVQTVAGEGSAEPPGEFVTVDLSRVVASVVDELGPLLGGLGMSVRPLAACEPIFVRSVSSTLGRCVASALIAFAPETAIEIGLERGPKPAVVFTARRGALEARPLATEALRRTLAKFGGSLVLSSDAGGATVRLELASAPPPAGEGATASVTTSQAPTKLRVLVIDDEALLLRATARMLSDYEVTTASSGAEALDRLRACAFDVVLCDFNMPEMQADAVLTSAIALGFDPARFVVMTGGSYEEVEAAFGDRLPLVLPKPFTRRDLESTVRRIGSPE